MVQKENKEVTIWKDLYTRDTDSKKLFSKIRSTTDILTVSINISPQCNLKCRHCFYGTDSSFEEPLSITEWESVIRQLLKMKVRHFHISGREPFLDDKTIEVLKLLSDINKTQQIKFGVITNGIFFKDCANKISDLKIGYLDFSIDGLSESHEFLRGKDTFNKVIDSVKLAISQKIAKKIFVSSVVHKQNYKDIPQMIQYLHELGVRNYYLTPMQLYGRGTKLADLFIDSNEYNELINCIHELIKQLDKKSPLRVIIYLHPVLLTDIFKKNVIVKKGFNQYIDELDSDIKIGSSILTFGFHLFCTAYWRGIKITADGYYTGCWVMLTATDYRKYSLGNVRQSNIKELYQKSLSQDSLIHQICEGYDEHICKEKDCFNLCNGGCPVGAFITHNHWKTKDVMCKI